MTNVKYDIFICKLSEERAPVRCQLSAALPHLALKLFFVTCTTPTYSHYTMNLKNKNKDVYINY